MLIEIVRQEFPTYCTLGILTMHSDRGNFSWNVLEDVDRFLESGGIKIPKETAIPIGDYKLIIDQSERFNGLMPHILDVPQFTGVRIHWGVSELDTEGCPMIGKRRTQNPPYRLSCSVMAFVEFYSRLYAEIGITKKADLIIRRQTSNSG